MDDIDALLAELSDDDIAQLTAMAADEGPPAPAAWPALPVHAEQLAVEAADPAYRADQIHLAFRVSGPLDAGVLVRAHTALAARHPALRYVLSGDAAGCELVESSWTFPVRVDVVPHVDDDLARDLLRTERARRLSLREGPLARAVLATDGVGEHLLVWSLSHAVADGWSLGVLWDDLAALYGGCELPPVPPFGAFTAERAGERSAAPAAGAAALTAGARVPASRAPRAVPLRLGSVDLTLEPEVRLAVERAAARLGATTFMVLLGAFRLALADAGAVDEDATVWSPLAGRTSPTWSGTVGMFVTALPVPVQVPAGPAASDLVDAVKEGVLQVLDLQHLDRAALGVAPEAAVLFAMQNTGGGTATLPGCTVRVVRPDGEPQMAPVLEFYSPPDELFLVSATAGYRAGGLTILLEHDLGRLGTAIVADVAERLRRILVAVGEAA